MEILDKFLTILEKTDVYGNKMSFDPSTGTVSYFLKQKNRELDLGRIFLEDDKIIYQKKEKERDRLRIKDAWSIPEVIAKEVDEVRYISEKATYICKKKTLDRYKEYLLSDRNTADRKRYVRVHHWMRMNKDEKSNRLLELLGNSWYDQISFLFRENYMKKISDYINPLYDSPFVTIYPERNDIFNAFRTTVYDDIRVVIIGNSPITSNEYEGLAFSVNGGSVPDVTIGLLDAVEKHVYDGFMLEKDPNLNRWADQGILLLNAALTAEPGNPHRRIGWDEFIKDVLVKLQERGSLVYLLWGDDAEKFKTYIDTERNLLMTGPAPDSKVFIEQDYFNETNRYLAAHYKPEIKW